MSVALFQKNNVITESACGNRFLFQGREYDYDTALYYFRARWYEPETGRWLSPDPIGISGGLNLYVFCGNDPVNYIDPSGLAIVNNKSKKAVIVGGGLGPDQGHYDPTVHFSVLFPGETSSGSTPLLPLSSLEAAKRIAELFNSGQLNALSLLAKVNNEEEKNHLLCDVDFYYDFSCEQQHKLSGNDSGKWWTTFNLVDTNEGNDIELGWFSNIKNKGLTYINAQWQKIKAWLW